jgi:hypothetical protein
MAGFCGQGNEPSGLWRPTTPGAALQDNPVSSQCSEAKVRIAPYSLL